MKKLTTYLLIFVGLFCCVPLIYAAQNKAITPMLSLLLSGNDECVANDSIAILSIHSDRSVPFAPVTLTVDNIASIVPGTSYITYNDFEIPISDVDYETGTITSLLPNTPGTVQVSITSPCATTANSTSITIGPLSLPTGKTVDGILSDFSVEIATYHSAMQAEANNHAHTAEQREGYARLALEYDAYKQIFEYLLSTIADENDRKEAAALLVNFLASSAVPAVPAARAAMAYDISVQSVGTAWSTIESRRISLKTAGVLSATTDWGSWGILTNNPVIKFMDACLSVIKILGSSKGLLPSLLDDFVVDVTYPAGGFYRDSGDAELSCNGTFIPFASLFVENGLSALIGELVGAIKSPKLDGAFSGFIGQGIETTLLSDILKDETMAQLATPIKNLSIFYDKAVASMVSESNVEFPCIGGVKLSKTTVHRPPHRVDFSWGGSTSTATPVLVGIDYISLLFMDSLNNDEHKVIEATFSIEVENHPPEVTNSPSCYLDGTGKCDFWVEMNDQDIEDYTIADFDSSNSLNEGSAVKLETQTDKARFMYQSNDPSREDYTDLIKIRYEDNYEYFIISVNVIGQQPGPCPTYISGPQTVDYAGHEWQRCDDGNFYNWDAAKAYCADLSLAGHSDWRLPTKDELKSLVVCTNDTPTPLYDDVGDDAYPTICDNSENAGPYERPTWNNQFESFAAIYYVSSSVYDATNVWYVEFYRGESSFYLRTNEYAVRCVR